MKKAGLSLLFLLVSTALFSIEVLDSTYGPRPLSLGGAYVAVGGDPESIFWNPGGIPTLDYINTTFGYQSHIAGINFYETYIVGSLSQTSLNIAFLKQGTFGLGFVYWNTEEESWNGYNESVGTIGAREYMIGLSYKQNFGGIINLGTTLKFANSDIAGAGDSALVLDVGALSTFQGVGIGLLVKNIGFSSSAIPMGMGLGAYYTFFKTADNLHTIAGSVELDSVQNVGFSLKFGSEYTWYGLAKYDGKIRARLGYDTTSSKDLGILAGLSFGVGIDYFGISLNYTLLSYGLMGFNHDITLSYALDNLFLRQDVSKDGAPPVIFTDFERSLILFGEDAHKNIKVNYTVQDNVGIQKIVFRIVDKDGGMIREERYDNLRGTKKWSDAFVWNGKDAKGQTVEDGVYSVRIEAEDLNMNEKKSSKEGLIVSSDSEGVIIAAKPDIIRTVGETINFSLIRKGEQDLDAWRITIKDSKGKIVKRFGAKKKATKAEDFFVQVGLRFEGAVWDGTDLIGKLVKNGEYEARMQVEYVNGMKRSSFPVKLHLAIGVAEETNIVQTNVVSTNTYSGELKGVNPTNVTEKQVTSPQKVLANTNAGGKNVPSDKGLTNK